MLAVFKRCQRKRNSINNIYVAVERIVKIQLKIDKQLIKFAGGFAGVMSWLLTHPADVVKSRIQAQERFHVRFNYLFSFKLKQMKI